MGLRNVGQSSSVLGPALWQALWAELNKAWLPPWCRLYPVARLIGPTYRDPCIRSRGALVRAERHFATLRKRSEDRWQEQLRARCCTPSVGSCIHHHQGMCGSISSRLRLASSLEGAQHPFEVQSVGKVENYKWQHLNVRYGSLAPAPRSDS
jgi:hypothetical protein